MGRGAEITNFFVAPSDGVSSNGAAWEATIKARRTKAMFNIERMKIEHWTSQYRDNEVGVKKRRA